MVLKENLFNQLCLSIHKQEVQLSHKYSLRKVNSLMLACDLASFLLVLNHDSLYNLLFMKDFTENNF